jgi:ABC-type multidrug transport system, ATPase and permease components
MTDMIRHAAEMLRRYAGGAIALNIAGMVLAALLEGAGILLIVPLLGASGFLDGAYDAVPMLAPLIRQLERLPGDSLLPVLLGLFVLVVVFQCALQWFVAVRNTRIVQRCGRRLRLDLFDALQDAGWSFYLRRRRTDLMNAMTTETARVLHGFGLIMQAAAALIFTVLQIGIALAMSWTLTALVLVCGAAVLTLSRRLVGKAKALGSLTSELAQEYLAGVHDRLQGMKDIKSNDMADGSRRWIRGITERLLQEQIAYVRLRSGTDAVYRILSAALVAAFAYVAVRILHTPPHTLLLIVVIFARLWPRIALLQSQAQQLAAAAPALAAVRALLEECRRERDAACLHASLKGAGLADAAPGAKLDAKLDAQLEAKLDAQLEAQLEAPPHTTPDATPGAKRGQLRLEQGIRLIGVSFGYDGSAGRKALDGIDLFIPARGTTAIVGHSGAGKSTLVDVVTGLIRPQEGEIRIDDRPLTDERLAALRRSVGYVPQDPFLFGGTILDNLRMARPGATEEEAREALRLAAADGFVSRLPHGMHTPIGDRGVRLSGGERQRIVLARAILRNPRILILDEATSALDSESEAAILHSLDRLRGAMTIIMIAHRLSTIRSADQVVVMEQGRIVQCGRYAALAADRTGLFDRLLRQQATSV